MPSRGLASRVRGICSRNVGVLPHVLSTDPSLQASQTPQLPTCSPARRRMLSLSTLAGEFALPRSGPQPTSQRNHFSAPAGSLRVTGLHWPPKILGGIRLDAPRGTCMSTCFPPGAHPLPGSPSISSQASCSPWNSYLQIHPGMAPPPRPPRPPPPPPTTFCHHPQTGWQPRQLQGGSHHLQGCSRHSSSH